MATIEKYGLKHHPNFFLLFPGFRAITLFGHVFYRMNKEDICSQSLSILSMMISFLDLKSLWGYGFPAISIYSFILRSFLEYHQIPVSFI